MTSEQSAVLLPCKWWVAIGPEFQAKALAGIPYVLLSLAINTTGLEVLTIDNSRS